MTSRIDLFPLPHADANAALQRESLAALRSFLPHDSWILRDERMDDFGVDASLEVLESSRATNFRAQLQVKARSGLKANQDGSISVQIETSNFNYLLNHPVCPIYVLYRPEVKELRYCFVEDEHCRIHKTNPDWKVQQSVVLRFLSPLDAEGLAKIRRRIMSDAHSQRRFREFRDSSTDYTQFSGIPRELPAAAERHEEKGSFGAGTGGRLSGERCADSIENWVIITFKPLDKEASVADLFTACLAGQRALPNRRTSFRVESWDLDVAHLDVIFEIWKEDDSAEPNVSSGLSAMKVIADRLLLLGYCIER